MPVERVSFSDQVRSFARALAFDVVGIARADVRLEQDAPRYEKFIASGMHGEMSWLADNGPVRARLDGDGILPGARSVICVARRYQRPPEREAEDGEAARSVARYARGRDYHKFMRKRLRR